MTKPAKGTDAGSEGPGAVESGDADSGPGAASRPSQTSPVSSGAGQSKPGQTESSASGVIPEQEM